MEAEFETMNINHGNINQSINHGMQKDCRPSPEARTEAMNRYFLRPSEGINSAHTLMPDF